MKKGNTISMTIALVTIFTMILCTLTGGVIASESSENYGIMLISENPFSEEVDTTNSISVLLDGATIDFTDSEGNVVEPQIINSRTMVPMRKIFEVLGAEIEWDGNTGTVTATTDESKLTLQIGNEVAKLVNSGEEKSITLDSVPTIVDGRTLVPVRFIAESLELKVGWDARTRTVIIINPETILERLRTEAPLFCEYLETRLAQNITSYRAEAEINGILDYTNAGDKTSNTNLKFIADGDVLFSSEKLSSLDFNVKTTGKGKLYETIKENKFNNIDIKAVLDLVNKITYIKSNLIESEVGKKWAKIDVSSENINIELNNIINSATGLNEIISITLDNITLTPTTYYEIKEIMNVLCPLLSNKYFKVTGRNAKTYTYELTLSDILDTVDFGLSKEIKTKVLDMANLKITLLLKEDENKMPKNEKTKLEFSMNYDDEKIVTNFEIEIKYNDVNKNVTVSIPLAKDIVEM